MKYILLLLLAAACLESCAAKCVKTQQGRVNGTEMTSRNGRRIHAFVGIPYAQPPVGPLRFRSPVLKTPWTGSLNAHEDRPECLQKTKAGLRGSEDCLYLSVFTPQINPTKLLPVLVFLHGGSFQRSNASLITSGPGYFLDKDNVFVTFNYRLGILGFMSTGDLACPGNFGLKDATLVLQWIQMNIAAFGGDRNEVTILGQDAGAEMVHLLLLSDKSKPLFKRGIQQSGMTPLNFAGDPSYYDKAKMVAQQCNCPTGNSVIMVECLRRRDAADLLNATAFDKWDQAAQAEWRFTVEPRDPDAVTTDTPMNQMKQRRLKDCPLMSGTVKNEGTAIVRSILADAELYRQCVNDPVNVIKRFLRYYYYYAYSEKKWTEVAMKAKNFYFGEKMPSDRDTIIAVYERLISDLLYEYPQFQIQDYMLQFHPDYLYAYKFQYRGALSLALSLGGKLAKCGVAHGDNQFYQFPLNARFVGPRYSNLQRTPNDYKIVDLVIDLWSSFCANGIPVSPLLDTRNQWQSYKSEGVLNIGGCANTTSVLRRATRSKGIQFWYDNLPSPLATDSDEECN